MTPNHRRCISCRTIGPKQQFWRVVRNHQTGAVQLDQGMGRSAYLCPSETCLRMAQKKNRLGRALRTAVDDGIYGQLWQRLSPSVAAKSNNKP
jgi:predicted RNA-binding protein YlxR (DUF448 family)